MDNLSSNVQPEEIPDGFTVAQNGGDNQKQSDAERRELQRRMIVEQALTPEALARLGTIRLVKPEKVATVEASIVSLATSGKLSNKITEGKLIELLEGIIAKSFQSGTSISIRRKKYAFDSDDGDEDNDDDLM